MTTTRKPRTTKPADVLAKGRPIQGVGEPHAAYRARLDKYTTARDKAIRADKAEQ